VNGALVEASPLFQWQFVLGYPIGEAFWSQVTLAGTPTWVMIQPFERRVLTYTPGNDPNWRVEMGNIGQHYRTWRYQQLSTSTAPTTVEIGDFYYAPPSLSVAVGTTVAWTVVGQRTNSVTANDGSWGSPDLNHGDLYTHKFNQPGVFTYHSRYYGWMTGTIIVRAASP
jgi:plastocyanin